jgi:hypothetical protein
MWVGRRGPGDKEVLVSEQTTYDALEDQHIGHDGDSVDQPTVHLARFSEGIEQRPQTPETMRRRRFSEGIEQVTVPGKLHIGRFSEGIEQLPETVRKLRRGSFADGLGQAARRRRRTAPTRRLRPAA